MPSGNFGANIVRLADPDYETLYNDLSAIPFGDPARDAIVIEMNDIIVSYSTIPLVERGSVSAFANNIEGQGVFNGWDSEYWNIEDWSRTE